MIPRSVLAPVVARAVASFAASYRHVERGDILSEAWLHALEAAKKYDASQGAPEPYVFTCLNNGLRRKMREYHPRRVYTRGHRAPKVLAERVPGDLGTCDGEGAGCDSGAEREGTRLRSLREDFGRALTTQHPWTDALLEEREWRDRAAHALSVLDEVYPELVDSALAEAPTAEARKAFEALSGIGRRLAAYARTKKPRAEDQDDGREQESGE